MRPDAACRAPRGRAIGATRARRRRAAPVRTLWLALALSGAAGTAQAAEAAADPAALNRVHPWFLRLNLAGVLPQERGETQIAGQPVPGNTVTVNDSVTVSLDLGRFITENIAVAAIVGMPARATLRGANALAGVGAAATAHYGPAALLLQYHPPPVLGVRPYIGAGVTYTAFVNVQGAALQDPKVRNAWGSAFQIGVDAPINERWAINLDAVQVLVSTTATGTFQGLPVSSDLTVNPLILRAGVTWRF